MRYAHFAKICGKMPNMRKSHIRVFLTSLYSCQTPCVQVFKSLVRGQPPSNDVIPNSVYLHTYIIYLRQTYTVERNLLMIEALQSSKLGDGKKNRPQDFARLYDCLLYTSDAADE